MVAHVSTVTFEGIEVVPIDVQVQTVSGLPTFAIVGLPDKAVGESKERVRAAIMRWGWRCRRGASSSTCRQPTF